MRHVRATGRWPQKQQMAKLTAKPILVAGGGPVGFITALALARQGLPVHVYEAEPRVMDMPRAATTHAATLEMLAGLGMVDEVIERGLVEPLFRVWDRVSNTIVAEFDFGLLKDETPYPFAVQCEQHKLAAMAIARLRAFPHAKIEFSARVTGFAIRRWRRSRGRDRRWRSQGGRQLPDRLRRRTLDGAQGARHRVRGLHPPGAVSDPDHVVRPRHHVSRLHAQLPVRSERLVLAVQGQRRRRRPAVARAVRDQAGADREPN